MILILSFNLQSSLFDIVAVEHKMKTNHTLLFISFSINIGWNAVVRMPLNAIKQIQQKT